MPPADPPVATGAPAGWRVRVVDAIVGTDPRRRPRTRQVLFSMWVYSASACVLWFNMRLQPGYELVFAGWCAFVVLGLSLVFATLRNGWSDGFEDPGLTIVQIALGVLVCEWGYVICGPARSLTLFPMLLLFVFGAFSLDWRRITMLTLFALASLLVCVATLHVSRGGAWSLDDADLRVDLSNVAMVLILLPAVSVVAARLSSMRRRLRSQRAELMGALREVQRLATNDELTGLANRRHMQQRLEQERKRWQRTGSRFSIAVIDLDHFKRINDSQGHAAGDAVLHAFAMEALDTLRDADVLSRWGGEEFLLLLPDTDAAQARASVTRLLDRVRAMPSTSGVPLTFSAGVTEHRPGEPLSDTVARADRLMYGAKQGGRDMVRME